MKRLEFGLAGAFADQAIVSFGNFALNVALARTLSAADYGVFSVTLSFILFLNTLHQAFVTYPLAVRGAAAKPEQYRHLLGVATMLTPLCALAFLPVLGAGVLSVGRISLLPLAFLALVAWQLQEVFRRGLLARARYPSAIAIDLVRYVGAFFAVLALAARVTVGGVFLLIAATSLAAIVPSARRVWPRGGSVVRSLRPELAVHWQLAAPLLGASLLAALSSQWFLWLLAWLQNPGGAGALVALANVVAIANPVIFGVETILISEVARAQDRLAFPDLVRLMARRGLVCALLVAPFFLLIVVYPEEALRIFYGRSTPFAIHPNALRILAAAYASYLGSYIFGAVLRGYRASGAVFKMQLYPALFGITLGSWLTWRYGVSGACMASLLAGLLRAGIGLQCVMRLRSTAMPTAGVIGAA